MRERKIYLDTSVLNFFFEEGDLEKANSTKALFKEIQEGKFDPFISELVLREIGQTKGHKREKLLSLIRTYKIPWLAVTKDCLGLSEKYMKRKIFPPRFRDDAIHIAIATAHHLGLVVESVEKVLKA